MNDSQLVTQDRSESLRTREDILHREALALLDASSVLSPCLRAQVRGDVP
ncbi:hypothetical protein ACMHYB_61235 [Sorangium sp. So ce1128]